ncbi:MULTISPECIES: hypothetical protein [unclassified Lysinibacillus]|uniref:hypothetical protein n=1 Tax=unclassified Lysinibacillus TaxID=2636778 RepID=UPI00201321E9|nr:MULTISPECIES: hypothetical protein [unclassified Lysinibacillus]MCL1698378.1 hypothetical protein [Lysinibacillus sp. BPa_S21]MCL1702607.1 hypothetical protein [Lysinibacillus sp. Bpr_S20]
MSSEMGEIHRTGQDINDGIVHFGGQAESVFSSLAEQGRLSIQKKADALAAQYLESNPNPDYYDCVEMVAEGVLTAGNEIKDSSGSWGDSVDAALGAGVAIPAAKIACKRISMS